MMNKHIDNNIIQQLVFSLKKGTSTAVHCPLKLLNSSET